MKVGPRPGISKAKTAGVVAVVFLFAGVVLYGVAPRLLSSFVLPTFEGPSFGVGAFAPDANAPSSYYTVNQSLVSPYSWGSTDVHQAVIQDAGGAFLSSCKVEVDVQNPQPASPPSFLTPQTVSYWVNQTNPGGSTTFTHVYGSLSFWTAYIDVKAIDTGGINQCVFSNNVVWLELVSSTWDQAYQAATDASGNTVYGQAWSSVIFGSVSSFQQTQPGQFHDIVPDHQGADLTFYSAPGAALLSDLGYSEQQSIGSQIQGTNPLAPSSSMSEFEWTPITLSNYGVTNLCTLTLGDCSPVTDYTVSLVSLTLGKYTLTEPAGVQPPHGNPPPSGGPSYLAQLLGGASAFFTSPYGIFVTILAVAVIIAALWAVGKMARWLLL